MFLNLSKIDTIKYGDLTEEKKELYKLIFYRITATKTIVKEIVKIKDNGIKVKNLGITNILTLIFHKMEMGQAISKKIGKKIILVL